MLTPMNQYIQDKILLAVHPDCTIEQARERELKIEWCMLSITYTGSYTWEGGQDCDGEEISEILYMGRKWETVEDDYYITSDRKEWYDEETETHMKIIGLPPTLERTLAALGEVFGRWHHIIWLENKLVKIHRERIMQQRNFENLCDRKLLNENWQPCDLFQQDESTQKSIAFILWYKDE